MCLVLQLKPELSGVFQKNYKIFRVYPEMLYLHSHFWELSSAGSEHLPYKQRVIGSNPVAPTRRGLTQKVEPLFIYKGFGLYYLILLCFKLF